MLFHALRSRLVRSALKASSSALHSLASCEMADEKDVGILCYANPCQGFRGVLKHRYSDFIVNEVGLDGSVVHLTNLDAPQEEVNTRQNPVKSEQQQADATAAAFSVSDYELQLDAFKALAGDENGAALRELLQKIADGAEDASATLQPDGDKARRTQVHSFFRERLPIVVTDTVNQNGEQCVRIRYDGGSLSNVRGKRPRGRGRERGPKRQKLDSEFDTRGRDYWPPERKKFCQFHLYKENRTTQSAIMIIAQKLGTKAKSFGFSGTKDKRAITTQRATVFKYSATKLAALNKHLIGIKIGNFSYVDNGLALGQLLGNRFTITLRDVVAESDAVIENAVDNLKRTGFINYYGLQRFGNGGVATHFIGAKLLRGDWKGAVDLVLESPDTGCEGNNHSAIGEARKLYQSGDLSEALKHMPHHMVSERSLLFGLKKSPGNFLQALDNIPRPMRMMYVHSYQSYLWNNAASYRIETYGIDNVIEGDLVYDVDECEEKILEPDSNLDDVLEDDVDVELTVTSRKKVKHVTKEDILSNRYTISDVVLPLPGCTTVYPANDVASVYQKFSSKDSVDLKSSTHKVKQFSMEHCTGSYRHIVVKPSDFDWKLLRYDDSTKPLAQTDLERLENFEAEASISEGSMLALQLEFTLPSSAYATMALRELMKMSTSVAVHKSLTQAHENPSN